jgi:sugar phosphate isomerase/epimerase
MRFCIRREIDLNNSEERLRRVERVPVEIALPPQLDDFLRNRHLLSDVKLHVDKFGIPVRSLHAPHGDLADPAFGDWADEVVGLAEALGAETAVFHPETRPGERRSDGQAQALGNIRSLQERTKVTIAVETFWEDDRVLTPDEIMDNRLPMVLDTSRIPKPEITWIMESYHTHVKNVHLSAVTPGGEHPAAMRRFRPIDNDPFCLDILDRLHELGWNGVVTLEYMPWLSSKSMEDRHLLESIYHYPE